MWGNPSKQIFEKGKTIFQIFLKASLGIKQSKVNGLAQDILLLGIKCQDGGCQISMDDINKITAISPLTSKKAAQAFLGIVGFWRLC